MPEKLIELANREGCMTQAEAETYQWWGNFLEHRLAAVRAMRLLGKDTQEIARVLSFNDEAHVLRVMASNRID